MKKSLLILLLACLAAVVFASLHRRVAQSRAAMDSAATELNILARQLAEEQKTNAVLRGELQAKQNHLRMVARHPGIKPELLALAEKNFASGSPAAWAQLRQQLNLGWNASPDYVLVNKQVLKDVTYDKFSDASRVTSDTCDLLSLSSEEKSALNASLKQLHDTWASSTLARTEPSGDIVAQYTLNAPDEAAFQSLSNNFVAGVTAAIGPERANLLLPWGWNEFKNQLSISDSETMTIRQTTVNGESDLTYQIQKGSDGSKGDSSGPVRYANYPTSWFLTYFPGGWDTLAQREGFQLPPAFHKQQ